MTASKIYLYIYTVTVIPDCVPEKVAHLKESAGTLVFQPHYTIDSCGALCTYSLYDKQVNGARCVANGTVHQAISRLNPLLNRNRKRGTLQIGGNCFAPDCDSPLDTLLELCN